MAGIACPERDEIRDFLLGKLDPQKHQSVVDHIELCAQCQTAAETINLSGDTLASVLKSKSEPDRYEAECKDALDAVQAFGQKASKPQVVANPSSDSLNDVTLMTDSTDSVATSKVSSSGQTQIPTDTQGGDEKVSKLGNIPEQFGRYRLLKALGQGGMGAVYLAQDPELDRKLAIKVPFVEGADRTAVLDRFRREARSVAQIHHPNICPIYDVSEVDGIYYMAMAFMEGRS